MWPSFHSSDTFKTTVSITHEPTGRLQSHNLTYPETAELHQNEGGMIIAAERISE